MAKVNLKIQKIKVKLIWDGDEVKENPIDIENFGEPQKVELSSISDLPSLANQVKVESETRLSIAKKHKKSFYIKSIITQ